MFVYSTGVGTLPRGKGKSMSSIENFEFEKKKRKAKKFFFQTKMVGLPKSISILGLRLNAIPCPVKSLSHSILPVFSIPPFFFFSFFSFFFHVCHVFITINQYKCFNSFFSRIPSKLCLLSRFVLLAQLLLVRVGPLDLVLVLSLGTFKLFNYLIFFSYLFFPPQGSS